MLHMVKIRSFKCTEYSQIRLRIGCLDESKGYTKARSVLRTRSTEYRVPASQESQIKVQGVSSPSGTVCTVYAMAYVIQLYLPNSETVLNTPLSPVHLARYHIQTVNTAFQNVTRPPESQTFHYRAETTIRSYFEMGTPYSIRSTYWHKICNLRPGSQGMPASSSRFLRATHGLKLIPWRKLTPSPEELRHTFFVNRVGRHKDSPFIQRCEGK